MEGQYEREEQKQRAQAWYAIMGLGALVAGVLVIMSYLPNNPFHVPSELPGTSRLNSDAITGNGTAMPMLAVTPSQRGSIGPGCRVSDVALVQEHRNALRQTVTEGILAYADRARGRFETVGWTAGAGGEDAGADVGCVVSFAYREGRSARVARWVVAPDRQTVTPVDDRARAFSAAFRRSR